MIRCLIDWFGLGEDQVVAPVNTATKSPAPKSIKIFITEWAKCQLFKYILFNAVRCFKWACIFKIVKLRQLSLGIEKFLNVIFKAGTYVSYDSHILHIYKYICKYACKGYIGHLQQAISYIYIYMCVCVCVCADREGLNSVGQIVWRMKKHYIKWSRGGISNIP